MLTLRTLVGELELTLLSGDDGADAPVRWVHITELPDPTPWLSGGELLLTTGLQLDTPKLQREFARRLSDHHLAGLGFGTGFGHSKVPQPLLKEAEALAFPVFEVPYEVPFIALTEKAFTRLVNEQYDVLQRGIATHKRLERLVIEERGLDELVRAVAAAIGGAVMVLDARGEPIAERAFRRPLPRAAVEAVSEQVRARGLNGSHAGESSEFVPDHPEIAGRSLALAVSSRGGELPRAWLVATRDAGGLGDFERLILQQAATVVALELMRQRAMRDTERRLAGDVLAEALGETAAVRPANGELNSRLLPFDVGDRSAVLVFAPQDGTPRPASERALDRFLADAGVGALVAVRDQLLCAVVDCSDAAADPLTLAARAREAMRESEGDLRAAASRPAPTADLRRSFHEARCALEAVSMANGDAPEVASYRDLGAFQLLLSLQDDDALRLYCDSVLGPTRGRRR